MPPMAHHNTVMTTAMLLDVVCALDKRQVMTPRPTSFKRIHVLCDLSTRDCRELCTQLRVPCGTKILYSNVALDVSRLTR